MRRRARGEGTLYRETDPRRSTNWRAEKSVRLHDRTVRITARGRTQDEALAALRRKEDDTRRSNPSADRLTLKQYLDRWLAFKRPQLAPSTVVEYERAMKHVTDRIGSVRLARLTPTDVQSVMDDLVREGTPATANAVRRYLLGALRQAERWELLQVNPLRNLEPVRRPVKEGIAWEPREIALFLAAVEHTRTHALFHTGIFTGLRIGELLALRWSDVGATELVVERTFARHAEGGLSRPKSRAGVRRVPIAAATHEVIERGRAGIRSEWAFPSATGTMLEYSNVRRALREGVERVNTRAKTDAERIREATPHDLRRTAATLWALQGVAPKTIQKLLGHSTPHLALSVYTKVYEAQLASAAIDPASVLGGGGSGGLAGRQADGGSDVEP